MVRVSGYTNTSLLYRYFLAPNSKHREQLSAPLTLVMDAECLSGALYKLIRGEQPRW